MATVLKILVVPRLPPGGSLGAGKRGTVPKIWRAVPIFLSACKWGFSNRDLRHQVFSWKTANRKMSRDHGLTVTFAVCLVHNTGPGCGAPGRRGQGVC